MTCSAESRDAGEPLAGTAVAGVRTWIVLRVETPWAATAPADPAAVPPPVAAWLAQLARDPSVRVQFVRRGQRPADPTHNGGESSTSSMWRLWVAHADETGGRLFEHHLGSVEDLVSVDVRSGVSSGGRELHAPIVLICTHGKRDRCCAELGLPVAHALDRIAPGRIWQTSHLGGHRFAPTGVILPWGLIYGRLDASGAEPLWASVQARRWWHADAVRGSAHLDAHGQLAEIEGRRRLGEWSIGAVRVERASEDPTRWRISRRVDDSQSPSVEVQISSAPARRLRTSCSDEDAREVDGLRVQ